MTSETFVFGGSVVEKAVLGAGVRRYARTLGSGHVEAALENYGNRILVVDARAFPLRSPDYCLQRELEAHLNAPQQSVQP